MKKQMIALTTALALSLTLALAGCAKDAEPAPVATASTTAPPSEAAVSTTAGAEEKVYCTATLEDDFVDDRVVVSLQHPYSMGLVEENRDLTAADFPGVDILSLERYSTRSGLINWDEYREILVITLSQHSKEHVLEMVKLIETFDYIYCAEPDYYLPDDWLDED